MREAAGPAQLSQHPMGMTVTTKKWAMGLLAAAINGASSAVVLVIADPIDFNLQEGATKLFWTSVAMAVLATANYLKTSPIPTDE